MQLPSSSNAPMGASDERFDHLARLALRQFGVLAAWLTTDDGRLCGHAGALPEVLPAHDPLPPGTAFLALPAEAGCQGGRFWLLHAQPRELDAGEREALAEFAALAAGMLADRRDAEWLRSSGESMALAISGSGTGIWDRNALTGEIHYSRDWKALLGYAEHEVSSRIEDSYTRVHPEDLAYVQATIQAHFDGHTEAYEVEHRLRCRDGSYIWVCSRGKVVERDAAGQALRMVGTTTDITERKQIETELQLLATTDSLTQLYNRRHFMKQLEAELARVQRMEGYGAAILMFDLDHFKDINDRWGHSVGDVALRHFSSILCAQLRRIDVAGRMGGEEFAVVLGNASVEQAVVFAQRVQGELASNPVLHGDERLWLAVSVGISVLDAADASAEVTLSRSDMALYRAKRGGRNRVESH